MWRPLCSKVLSSPLAIADASTISQKDLIETDQIFPDRIGEIYHLAYEKNKNGIGFQKCETMKLLYSKDGTAILLIR